MLVSIIMYYYLGRCLTIVVFAIVLTGKHYVTLWASGYMYSLQNLYLYT